MFEFSFPSFSSLLYSFSIWDYLIYLFYSTYFLTYFITSTLLYSGFYASFIFVNIYSNNCYSAFDSSRSSFLAWIFNQLFTLYHVDSNMKDFSCNFFKLPLSTYLWAFSILYTISIWLSIISFNFFFKFSLFCCDSAIYSCKWATHTVFSL